MFGKQLETWSVICRNEQGKEQTFLMLVEPSLSLEEKQRALEIKAEETDYPVFVKATYQYSSIHGTGMELGGVGGFFD